MYPVPGYRAFRHAPVAGPAGRQRSRISRINSTALPCVSELAPIPAASKLPATHPGGAAHRVAPPGRGLPARLRQILVSPASLPTRILSPMSLIQALSAIPSFCKSFLSRLAKALSVNSKLRSHLYSSNSRYSASLVFCARTVAYIKLESCLRSPGPILVNKPSISEPESTRSRPCGLREWAVPAEAWLLLATWSFLAGWKLLSDIFAIYN